MKYHDYARLDRAASSPPRRDRRGAGPAAHVPTGPLPYAEGIAQSRRPRVLKHFPGRIARHTAMRWPEPPRQTEKRERPC